jgi:hypothetical protein
MICHVTGGSVKANVLSLKKLGYEIDMEDGYGDNVPGTMKRLWS